MGKVVSLRDASRIARAKTLRDPLAELINLGQRSEPVSIDKLFGLVQGFSLEKRKEREKLAEAQEFIFRAYNRFSPSQRVKFFSMLYDRFAERYDEHMGIETNHYQAIKRVMWYAAPYIRFPLLDITAGTGEPLKYALEIAQISKRIRQLELETPYLAPNGRGSLAYANEISPNMLAKAKEKLERKARYTSHSAYSLPQEWREKFKTVLCSQTFHIISDKDKPRLVASIRDALTPDGTAIIIEEDPFKISQTPPIEAVSLFLRSVVSPIKNYGTLIAYFENAGLERLEERAVSPIDEEHSMRLHMFTK